MTSFIQDMIAAQAAKRARERTGWRGVRRRLGGVLLLLLALGPWLVGAYTLLTWLDPLLDRIDAM